jgi:hypothetical protein
LSQGAQRRLVEVKAASGPAQESLVGYLQRHLDTCPQLRSDQPVSGGILVVTISTNITRLERAAYVNSRPEFVRSLTVRVISTVELFNWWRSSDWAAIRVAVLDAEPPSTTPESTPLGVATKATVPPPRRPRLKRSRCT